MEDEQRNRLIYALEIISRSQEIESHELEESLVKLTGKTYDFDLLYGTFREAEDPRGKWKELKQSTIKEIAIGLIADAIVKK